MARIKLWNPFAFRSVGVQVIVFIVYCALISALLAVHFSVPSAPKDASPSAGVNITDAWRDLQWLSNGFHPYNSKRNDEVRNWLLQRIEQILRQNKVKFQTERLISTGKDRHSWNATTGPAPVVIFNDMSSNVTYQRTSNISTYFEGTNVIVYIRGTDETEKKDWWMSRSNFEESKGGVLVNAHYDSVASGFGATDDGVGVVTILQLISHFTSEGKRPKRGIVALLNNGEEDYLQGAYAFLRHPVSQFPRMFLNLEGAGAGGRAVLFRSSDSDVTKFYQKSSHPFGTAVSGDGFKRGLVRSETDYVVFNGKLGIRGLDVAFMEPRSKYHTRQDSARETSVDSLWHMLSSSLSTVTAMTGDTGSTFDGPIGEDGKVDYDKGTSDAVWFDMFGSALAVLRLDTLFALSVTLLAVTPIILIVISVILRRVDKWYLFTGHRYLHSPEDDHSIPINGWRGLFRFPVAFVVGTGAVVGLAFLVRKVNPYIVYSSPYTIWSMMLDAWFIIVWFILRGAAAMRPTALSRLYSLIWLYIGAYVALVLATIAEKRFDIAGSYFIVIYFAAVFCAVLTAYLELFALSKVSAYVENIAGSRPAEPSNEIASHDGEETNPAEPEPEPSEATSLLHGDRERNTFARYGTQRRNNDTENDHGDEPQEQTPEPYAEEQRWSTSLPSSVWVIQFLLLAPIIIILLGQIGLLITSALHQTPADGSPVLTVYIFIAALSVLILAPTGPFLHRFTFHIPTLLLLTFTGALVYNLTAFPFSPNARLKVFFLQTVDLDSGRNHVSLTGLDGYLRPIIAQIPSAAGQALKCDTPDLPSRSGLKTCAWHGLAPHVVPTRLPPGVPPEVRYSDWLHYSISRADGKTEAKFRIRGENTRACRLLFDAPVADFRVLGAADDERLPRSGPEGVREIRLWSRDWDRAWDVWVRWEAGGDGGESGEGKGNGTDVGLDGKVVCLWSDANEGGAIPALDEVWRFIPTWATVSKTDDGLVLGYKHFKA